MRAIPGSRSPSATTEEGTRALAGEAQLPEAPLRSAAHRLARRYPLPTFLLLGFGWTWLFWGAAIPLKGQPLLLSAVVLIGGFGPALAAVETSRLRRGEALDLSRSRLAGLFAAAAFLFGVLALRYGVGNGPDPAGGPGPFHLGDDLLLTPPIVLAALAACLVGGWVISGAASAGLRGSPRLASMLPRNLPPAWTLLALGFYPAMVLTSWGIAVLAGAAVEYPALWGRSALEVLPFYAVIFAVTLLMQGGNEEAGWRGFLQPALQARFSPLLAAILVSLVWSLWHLPLFLNGFYAEGGMLAAMAFSAIYRVFLAIFLAWFYARSGGNLFLTACLHATFNLTPVFLPTLEPGLLGLWVLVTAAIVWGDRMWRRGVISVDRVSPGRAALPEVEGTWGRQT